MRNASGRPLSVMPPAIGMYFEQLFSRLIGPVTRQANMQMIFARMQNKLKIHLLDWAGA